MKRSILWKMVLILAAIVSSILCLVVFLNYQLGEEYYISCEEKNMTQMLREINQVLEKHSLEDFQIDSTDARLELESLVGKTNMTVCVAYNSYRDIYTNGSGRSNVLRIMYRQFEYMWKYENDMRMLGDDGLEKNPVINEYKAVIGKMGGKPEEIREIIEKKGYCVCEMTSNNGTQKGLYLFSTYKGSSDHNLQIGIQISLDGIGSFGDLWWAGIEHSEPLLAVTRRLRRALAEADIPFDRKRFSPHITLIRRAKGRLEDVPADELGQHFGTSMTVDRISLKRSDRGKHGMVYTEL